MYRTDINRPPTNIFIPMVPRKARQVLLEKSSYYGETII